jgi:Undecaprenyl-phosphate glucose phosphotransferase
MRYRGILREHATALNALLHLSDWAAISLAAWCAHRAYLGSWELPSTYTIVVGITVLFSALVFPRLNLYRAWRGASIFDEVKTLTLAWGLVLFFLFAFAFATKMGINFSRGWIGIWSVLGWGTLVGGRVVLRVGLRWLRSEGFNQRRIVIVGTGDLGKELGKRLAGLPWLGLRVTGFFTTNASGRVEEELGSPILGALDDVAPFVAREQVDQVWIALPLKDEENVKYLLHELRHSTVDIRFIPDIFGFRLLNHSVMDVAGFPVLNLTATPMVGVNRLIKALEDRVLALVILFLISPLLLVIALGVKASSPGPVLFKQRRLGWDGKPIKVYKFRTMVVHQEHSGQVTQATKDDPRVTRFGAFLRRTSLDELPQFFNVLQGNMSIVGPRPHAVEHNDQYKDLVDDYMLRHKVKPGITGWAQVSGWRGETDTLEKMQKRVEYDLYYIENWSLWFDLRIILLTVFKGFFSRNAY